MLILGVDGKIMTYLVDWNEDELYEEAQETNSQKSNCCQASYF